MDTLIIRDKELHQTFSLGCAIKPKVTRAVPAEADQKHHPSRCSAGTLSRIPLLNIDKTKLSTTSVSERVWVTGINLKGAWKVSCTEGRSTKHSRTF